MKLKAEYEAQLQELKSHMNQNWEDKSNKSKKYEKERQLLLAKSEEEQKNNYSDNLSLENRNDGR